MGRVRVLLVAILACATVAAFVPSAAASVPAANTKFCKAAAKIGTKTSSNPTKTEAKKTAAQFKAAGKYAPAKVKSAAEHHRVGARQHRVGQQSQGPGEDLFVELLQEVHDGDRHVRRLLRVELLRLDQLTHDNSDGLTSSRDRSAVSGSRGTTKIAAISDAAPQTAIPGPRPPMTSLS